MRSKLAETAFAVVLVAVLVLATAPAPATGAHVNEKKTVEPDCQALEGPAQALELADPTAERWQFRLAGETVGPSQVRDIPNVAKANPRAVVNPSLAPDGSYEMVLESAESVFMPEDTFKFMGPEYSRLTGTVATEEAVRDVELTWVSSATDVYSPRLQAGAHMVLEGTMTGPEGDQTPIELRVTFPAATQPCYVEVHAFNWLHFCVDAPGEDPCVPAGYEITAPMVYYHNGPVHFAGTIGETATAGLGSGHGVAHNTAFAFVPP